MSTLLNSKLFIYTSFQGYNSFDTSFIGGICEICGFIIRVNSWLKLAPTWHKSAPKWHKSARHWHILARRGCAVARENIRKYTCQSTPNPNSQSRIKEY